MTIAYNAGAVRFNNDFADLQSFTGMVDGGHCRVINALGSAVLAIAARFGRVSDLAKDFDATLFAFILLVLRCFQSNARKPSPDRVP